MGVDLSCHSDVNACVGTEIVPGNIPSSSRILDSCCHWLDECKWSV